MKPAMVSLKKSPWTRATIARVLNPQLYRVGFCHPVATWQPLNNLPAAFPSLSLSSKGPWCPEGLDDPSTATAGIFVGLPLPPPSLSSFPVIPRFHVNSSSARGHTNSYHQPASKGYESKSTNLGASEWSFLPIQRICINACMNTSLHSKATFGHHKVKMKCSNKKDVTKISSTSV